MIDISDDHYALDISRPPTRFSVGSRATLCATPCRRCSTTEVRPSGLGIKDNNLEGKTAIPDGPPWPHVTNMLLGLWLIGTAPALNIVMPALLWSDVASGAAAVSFGALR